MKKVDVSVGDAAQKSGMDVEGRWCSLVYCGLEFCGDFAGAGVSTLPGSVTIACRLPTMVPDVFDSAYNRCARHPYNHHHLACGSTHAEFASCDAASEEAGLGHRASGEQSDGRSRK